VHAVKHNSIMYVDVCHRLILGVVN